MDRRPDRTDEGLTLIEVLVALLVFALLSTGIVAGLSTVTRMTADDRARVTAQNLAAREIDRMRALADPFKVMAATSATDRSGVDYVVDGRTYTIKRGVSWVSQAGADVSCGSGSSLFYVRINVRVTWPGMLANTAAVQDDTLMAPVSSLSDDSTGAISVSVADDASAPQAGVGVTITANTGGTTLAKQPANTDSTGCSYLGTISPGNYDVKLTKTGWIDGDQNATPTKTVSVVKGSTTTPQFQPYAQAATYTTKYVGYPVAYASSFLLPTAVETAWVNGGSVWSTSPSAQNKVITRYPWPTAYGVVAGRLKSDDGTQTCAAVDPQSWPEATVGTTKLASGVRATAYAAAGAGATASVPVGIVWVKAPAGQYFGATQATSPSGTPSCGISSVYTYATASTGGWQAIALPYGSWKLYYGTSSANATLLGASSIQIKTNQATWAVGSDGTVVLDPRAAK